MPALTPRNDEIRARNVTASECYALLGHHPYATKRGIFERLSVPWAFGHPEQTDAMALGSYLEPYVARWAAKRLGIKVRANPFTREHPKVPLCATPDYIVLKENMLMEVKVSSITYGWTENDLHPWYEYQARAQMACTGKDAVLVVALVGSAFHMVPVIRNDVKERMLTNAVEEFFRDHVLPGIPPAEEAPATRVTRAVVQGSM